MATSERFPKASDSNVRRDDSMMVYPPMDKMGIGARSSGLPETASTGPKSLEHVGKSSTGNGK